MTKGFEVYLQDARPSEQGQFEPFLSYVRQSAARRRAHRIETGVISVMNFSHTLTFTVDNKVSRTFHVDMVLADGDGAMLQPDALPHEVQQQVEEARQELANRGIVVP